MTKDARRNLDFEFNSLNLLQSVSASGTKKARYVWEATGKKLAVQDRGGFSEGYDYFSSFVLYRQSGGRYPEFAMTSEGRIDCNQFEMQQVRYFLRDHLGSVRAIMNNAEMISDRSDYTPYGARWSSAGEATTNRFLFSGKEKQVLGNVDLLDFGARMYDDVLYRWTANDPLAEKYYSSSPYAYALNNPVNAIDPDGRLVIFINGMHTGSGGKAAYWEVFDKKVMNHLQDYNARYYDGSAVGTTGASISTHSMKFSYLNPNLRYNTGYETGQRDAASILAQLARGEKIKVITHSMGAAYAKGFIQALIDMGIDPKLIAFEADFAPFQPTKQKAVKGVNTFQFSNENDNTANNRLLGSPAGEIEGAAVYDNNKDPQKGHAILDFWNKVNDLPTGDYNVVNGQIVPVKPKKK